MSANGQGGDGHTDGAGQPIGYVAPTIGKLALGLADVLEIPTTFGAPLADPRLVNNLGSPNTRRQDEGSGFGNDAGMAPTAASSAPLLGLNATS